MTRSPVSRRTGDAAWRAGHVSCVIDTRVRTAVATVSIGPYGTDPFNAAATLHAIHVVNQGAGMLSVIDPGTHHL
ncbi:MAG: hypothetical protein QOE72_4766 [Chloroflexota bacterium]|nr:hypothetical protein [Chloroflexota bacterium]